MPELVRSFFNPGGSVQTTGLDDLQDRQRGRAFNAQLQGDASRAQLADSAANRALQLQMGGSFADRNAAQGSMLDKELANRLDATRLGNEGSLATTRAANQPQLLRARSEQERYMLERGDTAPQRTLANQRAELEGRLFRDVGSRLGMGTPGAPGGSPDDALRQYMQLTNPQAYFAAEERKTARDDAAQDRLATLVTQLGASGNPQARVLAGNLAAKMAPFQGVSPQELTGALAPRPELITREQREADVGGAAKRFGERDAATFGFDPSRQDVDDIVSKRDQLAKYYQETQGADPAAAIAAANRVIEQQLLPNAERWGTGWIQTLRQALGTIR